MPMGNSQTFYQHYLAMIEQENKIETVSKVFHETGVEEVYFVLNKYWRNSEKIASLTIPVADKIVQVDNGEVYIFKFDSPK